MIKHQLPESPAEVEYKKARLLMNVQELGLPVTYKGLTQYIQDLHRVEDPHSSGLKTYVHLKGNPDMIPATEITIQEPPK